MVRTAYFDCFAGASGDMVAGALLDLGVDADLLKTELQKLKLPGWRMEIGTVKKAGVTATKVDVIVTGDGEHRPLRVILDLLERSELHPLDKSRAIRIFTRLGEAEGKVHGTPLLDVCFHEVGGVDAIIDIVAACVGVRLLALDRIIVSPMHVGSGFVKMAHGLYPVPGPATASLLVGAPAYATDVKGELVTPTGAAILTTLADGFGPMPPLVVTATGYGAGTSDREIPNVLRVIVGEAAAASRYLTEAAGASRYLTEAAGASGYLTEKAIAVEANIDDMNPEIYEYAMERLFDCGAMDVFLTPAQMKRNRPANVLHVLTAPDRLPDVLAIIFAETSTIGIRTYEVTKHMLPRETVTATTPYGPLRVKVTWADGRVVNTAPEYADCKAAARTHAVPLKTVYQAALGLVAGGRAGGGDFGEEIGRAGGSGVGLGEEIGRAGTAQLGQPTQGPGPTSSAGGGGCSDGA